MFGFVLIVKMSIAAAIPLEVVNKFNCLTKFLELG